MSKAGERMIAAAQELLRSLRNDKWAEYRTANGTLVFTPAIVVPEDKRICVASQDGIGDVI